MSSLDETRSWEIIQSNGEPWKEQKLHVQARTGYITKSSRFSEDSGEDGSGQAEHRTQVALHADNGTSAAEIVEESDENDKEPVQNRDSEKLLRSAALFSQPHDVDDMRKFLISLTKRGDVVELKKFMYFCSDESKNFQNSVLLYSTYDDYGSTLLQIAVENGQLEVVELLLAHGQFRFGSFKELKQRVTSDFEVVSRVLLLVYYLHTLSQSTLFNLSQSYPDSTLRDYVLARGIEAQDNLEFVSQESMDIIDAPFLQRLIGFMRKYANEVPTIENNDVKTFIGDPLLLASYDENEDSRHIVLLYAFASSAQSAIYIVRRLRRRFVGTYNLFNRIFSCKNDDPVSSGSKDLKFLFGRLVRQLKFEMLHARSQFKLDTALHTAILTESAQMADILLDVYDDFAEDHVGSGHFLDAYSMTPLHYAVILKSEKLIGALLCSATYVKGVNARDWSLRTPLHLACASGGFEESTFINTSSVMQLKVVKLLVNCKNIDLNAKDCCGFTPLHWAVYMRALEVVRYLLQFKDRSEDRTIRTTEKDVDQKTLLQHAMENVVTIPHLGKDPSTSAAEKKEIERLLMSLPGVKDEIDIMYRDRQVYVDAANAILVGAALIASVTYGGWLQPPSGSDDEMTLTRLRLFWGFNSLSFFSAIATVMAGAGAVLPMADMYIEDAVQRVRDWLALTSLLLVISVSFVLGAFAAAGFAALSRFSHLGDNMTGTTVIGSVECLAIGLLFFRGLLRVNNESPWKRFVKWAPKVRRHMSEAFQGEIRDSVKTTPEELDLKGGNGQVWHRHFALLICQRLFPDDMDKKLCSPMNLNRDQKKALVRCWAVLIDDFHSRKHGNRPVLPLCAYHQNVVGGRGVQHAIMHMSSTNSCRQSCLARDSIFLRDIRRNKRIDRERLYKVFKDVVHKSVH